MYKFFLDAVKYLSIPNYKNRDSLAENIDYTTLKAIIEWRNKQSILQLFTKYLRLTLDFI